MSKRSGIKYRTAHCGRCGEPHEGYSGKLDANGVEYVVCGTTHKRINVQQQQKISVDRPRDVLYSTVWEEVTA